MSFFNDDLDAIFNSMAMGFGRPTKVIFNTNGLKDQMPSFWCQTEKGYRCTLKTLGIGNDDINVETEDNGIKVSGKSKVEGESYDTLIELPIAEDVMDNIIEIKHKTINGLTFVDLIVDRPEKKKIKITKE